MAELGMQTICHMTKKIEFEDIPNVTAWLHKNAKGLYYHNFLPSLLDRFLDDGYLSNEFIGNIIFYDQHHAVQFKLIFTDWQEKIIKAVDEEVIKTIISKIMPVA